MCLKNAEADAPSQALGYVVEQRLQARQADDCLRVTYVSEAVRGKETQGRSRSHRECARERARLYVTEEAMQGDEDMAYVSEAEREERETWRE